MRRISTRSAPAVPRGGYRRARARFTRSTFSVCWRCRSPSSPAALGLLTESTSMIAAAFVSLSAILVPVWPVPFNFDRLVVGALAALGLQAIVAAFLHGRMAYGLEKWWLVVIVG